MSSERNYPEEEEWVAQERQKVIAYLSSQHCQHGGVGEWPAFHVDPYVALWAVQSRKAPGRIGWWAISGDLPTDYMSSSSGYHPREALRHFSAEWLTVVESMKRGDGHPESKIGAPEQWPSLAPLLERRAHLLREFADDDTLWEE